MPKFVPRQRKHKVLARQKAGAAGGAPGTTTSDSNPNVEILPSISQAEREARRQELRAQLRAQQPTVSSKKQKRLDKYIENKLRKDENSDYLRRLEKERERFDVSTHPGFASSKNLNAASTSNSKKRRFEDYVIGQVGNSVESGDRLRRGGFQVAEVNRDADTKAERTDGAKGNDDDDDDDDEDLASVDSFEIEHEDAFDENKASDTDAQWLSKRAPLPQGTGLAKPLEVDVNGLPIIPTRFGAAGGYEKKAKQRILEAADEADSGQDSDEVSWHGFESETREQELLSSDESSGTSAAENSDEEDDEMESEGDDNDDGEDSGEDSETETSISDAPDTTKIGIRTSAFKSWASQQLNQAIGHVPSYAANGEGELQQPTQKSAPPTTAISGKSNLINGLPEVKTASIDRRIHSIHVDRPESMQEARVHLPIIQREQEIMEAVHSHSVVVVKGDTGSGKTTQLPQFLYEAGYGDVEGPTPGLIGITQPRRVAAVSMARRVAEELGSHGCRVAHQIRFDSTVSSNTAIKFMTDGILLRELSQDLLLKKYSAIIIDEAHERSVNTDILIGMLSKIVPARMQKSKFNPDPKPLKLIVMSATLNIRDFLHDKLFSADQRPPVVEAEGRQHRVTTHFALRSRADYVEEVVEKVKRAHRKLPRGGILVFLTGQNEIRQVQSRLRKELVRSSGLLADDNNNQHRMHAAAADAPLEVDDLDFGFDTNRAIGEEDDLDILTPSDEEAEEREFDISDDEDENETRQTGQDPSRLAKRDSYDSIHILPLYSQLPTKEQLRVFEPPPERSRLIVIATNVAETSLTIPGIRFVFDCGRSKERAYNLETGVQSFEIDYISKASAQQRAGRAGRTGPGHCWRLYTSAVYEQFFPEHTEPEILRAPAESVVLQIKGFKYPRPVVDFPFPTPPTLHTLNKAEELLRNLGALDASGNITGLGKQLSIYPLSPRLAKILATGTRTPDCLTLTIALVAGLAVSEIYINDAASIGQAEAGSDDDDQDRRKQEYGRAQAVLSRHDKNSDALKLLSAVSLYAEAADKDAFCRQHYLRHKAMTEVFQLVSQLKNLVQTIHAGIQIPALKDHKLPAARIKQLNAIASAGYIDQVAVRWDCAPNLLTLSTRPRRAIDVPYLPLIPLKVSASADIAEKAIFIHPSSVLSRMSVKDLPQYVVYTHLQQAQTRTVGAGQIAKTRMFPLTPIDGASLARLASETVMIEYGKPLPKTKIDEVKGLPKRRICWVSTELKGGPGYGWNLPPTKVRQVMDVKTPNGWRVEEILT